MLTSPSRIGPYFGSVVVVPFNPAWQKRRPLKFNHPYLRLNFSDDGNNDVYLQVKENIHKIGSYPEEGITANTLGELATMNRKSTAHAAKRVAKTPDILAEWKKHGLLSAIGAFSDRNKTWLNQTYLDALKLLARAINGEKDLVHVRGPFKLKQAKQAAAPQAKSPAKPSQSTDHQHLPARVKYIPLGSEPRRGWLSKSERPDGQAQPL